MDHELRLDVFDDEGMSENKSNSSAKLPILFFWKKKNLANIVDFLSFFPYCFESPDNIVCFGLVYMIDELGNKNK